MMTYIVWVQTTPTTMRPVGQSTSRRVANNLARKWRRDGWRAIVLTEKMAGESSDPPS
ncbi:MAG: hypothetical protein OXQ29_26355 [Rhodospirillaceae bacterium]|nr:hypothetical protein [Rhodospirillaceae bacterium]